MKMMSKKSIPLSKRDMNKLSEYERYLEMIENSEYTTGYQILSGSIIYNGDVIKTLDVVTVDPSCSCKIVTQFCASDESYIRTFVSND